MSACSCCGAVVPHQEWIDCGERCRYCHYEQEQDNLPCNHGRYPGTPYDSPMFRLLKRDVRFVPGGKK